MNIYIAILILCAIIILVMAHWIVNLIMKDNKPNNSYFAECGKSQRPKIKKDLANLEGIKVGDKVYDISLGWGTVYRLGSHPFPIEVEFHETGIHKRYLSSGKEFELAVNQTLFRGEVKIVSIIEI